MACGDPPRDIQYRGFPIRIEPCLEEGKWYLSNPPPLVPYSPPRDDVIDAMALAKAGTMRMLTVVNRHNPPPPALSPGQQSAREDEAATKEFALDVDHRGKPLPEGACEKCGVIHAPGHPPRFCSDYIESRPPAVFDFDSIRHRMAQLRGDAPSGRYFREKQVVRLSPPIVDKRVIRPTELVRDGHDWDWLTDRCTRCLHTAMGIEEGFGPKVCPGKVIGEACIECGANAVQSAFKPGAPCYKVWCLVCHHSIWVDRRAPTLKLRDIAKTPEKLGHCMVPDIVPPASICDRCGLSRTYIVNKQKQCEGLPF